MEEDRSAGFVARWRERVHELRRSVHALRLAAGDPRVPWYAKGLVLLVVAYAFSPIDLIPDFIPLLGHLDDLVLLPLGIALAIHLIPEPVWAECRLRAEAALEEARPGGRAAALVIIALWLLLLAFSGSLLWRWFRE